MDWQVVGLFGTLFVSLLGSVFGYAQARRADRSASATKTIELGVKDLIDQYQEQNADLKIEVAGAKQDMHDCRRECESLRTEVADLTRRLASEVARREDLEAEVIALRRRLGELP